MRNAKCIGAVLRGLANNTITRPVNQKKFLGLGANKKGSWQPLLLRDVPIIKYESGEAMEKRIAYGISIVHRYWDKKKARQMVSSGPHIQKSAVKIT